MSALSPLSIPRSPSSSPPFAATTSTSLISSRSLSPALVTLRFFFAGSGAAVPVPVPVLLPPPDFPAPLGPFAPRYAAQASSTTEPHGPIPPQLTAPPPLEIPPPISGRS